MSARRAQLEAARAQAEADLADLEGQVADGEIDPATAERLGDVYRAEIAAADDDLAALTPDAEAAPPAAGRSPRRMLAGALLLVGGAALVTFLAVQAVEPRAEGGIATGGLPEREAPRDLADVTNEEMEVVVAANPDIVPMRLALARRYVEAGDFTAALPHYLTILESEPNPEALAYVGWMAYLSGEADVGSRYLERALEQDADYAVALWFLANVRFDGLGDAAGTVDLIDRLLELPDLPPEVQAAAEQLRDQAQGAG